MVMKKQVFLGGSCNPTTWRADIAVPALEAAGVAFYNPQVEDWSGQDAIYKAQGILGGIAKVDSDEKEASEVLLFVIDNKTRAIASILEATEYAVKGRNVALVVSKIADGAVITNQTITGGELKDLNRARVYLMDVASRNPNNVVVYPDVESAVKGVIEVLKQ